MIARDVNETHIREMQHCIGLDYKKPKRGKYKAYRNYFYCSAPNRIMQNVMQKRKNIMFRIHHIHIISHGMG